MKNCYLEVNDDSVVLKGGKVRGQILRLRMVLMSVFLLRIVCMVSAMAV